MNDEELAQYQAEIEARLLEDLSKPAKAPSEFRAQRSVFLSSLIDARLHKHLSQTTLAKKAGIQQSALSKIENGRGNPSLKTLLKIAKALDVNLVVE